MKNYKDFEKRLLGSTDIATLKVITNSENYELATGMDSSFSAYWIEGDAEIGEHYNLLKKFENVTWLVIGDEINLNIVETYSDGAIFTPKEVRIYNSGYHGYIIQVL